MNIIKAMVQRYNNSAYAQLKDTYLYQSSKENDLRLVEESQAQAFESEAANIKRKNPELYTAALEDLNYWMLQARKDLIRERTKLKRLYTAHLSSQVKNLLTEANITAASDRIVVDILGGDADPRYVDVFKQDIEPILQDFVKVR